MVTIATKCIGFLGGNYAILRKREVWNIEVSILLICYVGKTGFEVN
jgi:hypothetical protein